MRQLNCCRGAEKTFPSLLRHEGWVLIPDKDEKDVHLQFMNQYLKVLPCVSVFLFLHLVDSKNGSLKRRGHKDRGNATFWPGFSQTPPFGGDTKNGRLPSSFRASGSWSDVQVPPSEFLLGEFKPGTLNNQCLSEWKW